MNHFFQSTDNDSYVPSIPGISHYDIFLSVSEAAAKYWKPIKRKMYQWGKSIMDKIK